jgi:hypothetical protein
MRRIRMKVSIVSPASFRSGDERLHEAVSSNELCEQCAEARLAIQTSMVRSLPESEVA